MGHDPSVPLSAEPKILGSWSHFKLSSAESFSESCGYASYKLGVTPSHRLRLVQGLESLEPQPGSVQRGCDGCNEGDEREGAVWRCSWWCDAHRAGPARWQPAAAVAATDRDGFQSSNKHRPPDPPSPPPPRYPPTVIRGGTVTGERAIRVRRSLRIALLLSVFCCGTH